MDVSKKKKEKPNLRNSPKNIDTILGKLKQKLQEEENEGSFKLPTKMDVLSYFIYRKKNDLITSDKAADSILDEVDYYWKLAGLKTKDLQKNKTPRKWLLQLNKELCT